MTPSLIGVVEAAAARITLPAGDKSNAAASSYQLAGPLDQVNAWVDQWGTALQVLGGSILVVCIVIVGIKLGAKSAVASQGQGGGSGHREALGAVFGLALAGLLIGAALIIGPILVGVGKNTGTP